MCNIKRSEYGVLRRSACLVLVVASLLLLTYFRPSRCGASTRDGVVEFVVFDSPDCPPCAFLKEMLPRIQKEYGSKVNFRNYNIKDFNNMRLMINLESSYGLSKIEVPQVYVGKDAMIGPDQVKADLEPLIKKYIEQGGADLPRMPDTGNTRPLPEQADNRVYIAYFFRSGCRDCDAISLELDYMARYGSRMTVRRYDISTSKGLEMNEAMCEALSVPKNKRGLAPSIFVGDDYLAGKDLNRKNLLGAVDRNRKVPSVEPWKLAKDQVAAAKSKIEQRFKKIGFFTVLGAGLVDGINPCAFTVLVFLIGFLAFTDRRGREIVYVGGGFTLAVFLTYFLIGLGLFGFVRAIGGTGAAGKWLTIVIASLTAVFGLVAVYDYVRSRKKGEAVSTLGLSKGITRRIHGLIRDKTKTGYLVLGAVVLGVLITFLELGCTGQVYLPTITFVARSGGQKGSAILYLVLYDIMFILPLVVVFLLSYFGTSQEKLVEFGRKHSAKLELAGGLVLIGLAVLLFVTL